MALQAVAPTVGSRIDRLRTTFADQGIDALLVTNAPNRWYLSGFTGSNGMLLIGGDAAWLATDFRYWEQAGQQSPTLTLFQAVGPSTGWLAALLEPLGRIRLGFEATDLSYDSYRQLREVLVGVPADRRPELVPVSGAVERLRAVKEPGEVAALERVIQLADAAFVHVTERIEPGWTETQVAWELERYVREHGGSGMSFDSIIAAGAWGAMPHARARDLPLRAGDGVVIDMGARLDGYCSDMTRTITLGIPDARFREVYDIVFTAQRTAQEMIEPGMTGEMAHMLAQSVIDAAGYGEQFGHGLGHGIGLQVHESPWLRRTSTDVLQEGMVFSVEPGIYIKGWGGVRIEDLCVLENGRCRVLTTAPKHYVAAGQ